MSKFFKSVSKLTVFFGVTALLFMVLVMAISVFLRIIGINFLGNVELVEFAQLILVLCALTYAHAQDKHINIGIIVDHFPKPLQLIVDVIGDLAAIFFSFIVAYAFWLNMVEQFSITKGTTMVFAVPLYILKMVVVIGFILWGLESIHRLLVRVNIIKEDKHSMKAVEEPLIDGEDVKI
jgi:TRAP-type C4-dicarboxylate transport system permease small subunit